MATKTKLNPIHHSKPKTRAEAQAQARYWKQFLPRGFRIRVWENMGWHWCLGLDYICISPSYFKPHIEFWCLVTSTPELHSGCGSHEFNENTNSHYKSPDILWARERARIRRVSQQYRDRYQAIMDWTDKFSGKGKRTTKAKKRPC